jgi:hypothetical protein
VRITQSVLTFSELYNEIVTEVKGGVLLTDVLMDKRTDMMTYCDVCPRGNALYISTSGV